MNEPRRRHPSRSDRPSRLIARLHEESGELRYGSEMWGVVLATYDRGYEQGDLLQNFHDDEGLRVRRRRIGETSALLI